MSLPEQYSTYIDYEVQRRIRLRPWLIRMAAVLLAAGGSVVVTNKNLLDAEKAVIEIITDPVTPGVRTVRAVIQP